MIRAIYPGSFDPITYGHVDIIERASKIMDELIIGVLVNPKKEYLFTTAERLSHIELVTAHLSNVKVKYFSGLLVDFAAEQNINVIIRGLRAVTDFENEFQMALTNRTLQPDLETLFISTSTKYLYLCSSSVREIAYFGGDISSMVHPEIKKMIEYKYRKG